jgi:hypothetical protein
MKLKQNIIISRVLFIFLAFFLLTDLGSYKLFAQVIVNQLNISRDSLKTTKIHSDTGDSLVSPFGLQPLKPKPCNVTVDKVIAYILSPVDLDPNKYALDIPSQYYGKILKNGDDYEVYFPNKRYIGHTLIFGLPFGSGGIYNYHTTYGKVPIDILDNYAFLINKSEYNYCNCYIEVKQPDSRKIFGINDVSQGSKMRFSNMGFDAVKIGEYYDINIYSFDNSGQKLEQSFKVYLKYCSVTDANRCP